MKVMIGEFVTESNANIPDLCTLDHYDLGYGKDCICKMRVQKVFERENVEIIPSIFANAGPGGIVARSAFSYIESVFLDTVKENKKDPLLHGIPPPRKRGILYEENMVSDTK